MLFNSFEFLVFFLVVTTAYFLLPHKLRWVLLLGASCYFYMAFVPIYILILFFTIVVDYFAGILIEKTEGPRRRLYLIASLVANIGILCVFKYYNFFVGNINDHILQFASFKIPLLSILLPIGLSFHTFQAMSYTIEVYRGNQKAERHFGIYSLYVMFYPQLVAGPIERPQNILHQFHEKHEFTWANCYAGLTQMLWGAFKKIVIADRLAIVVGNVFNEPKGHNGLEIAIAAIFFSFQIYCDFSGYSDIALGSARVMGFKLMTNFDKPYFSTSISEFWKRWHISLSTWFKDYLYIPLGGNRVSLLRVYFNLFFVFMVSGLWHGANWTFIVWGALHGTFQIAGLLFKRFFPGLAKVDKNNPVQTSGHMLFNFGLVAFAWIFFRAASLSDATYLISHLGSGWHVTSASFYKETISNLGGSDPLYGLFNITLGSLLIIVLLLSERFSSSLQPLEAVNTRPRAQKWLVYTAMLLTILLVGAFEHQEFIYFQF